MISLICTHCQTELSIDDAFAGGVCRCQHCGTIQTVPSKRPGDPTAAAKNGSDAGRSLYQTQAREQRTSGRAAGLEELADIVASSGLGGSGLTGSGLSGNALRGKKAARAAAVVAEQKPNRTPLIILVGSVLLLGGVLAVWLAMHASGGRSADSSSPSREPASGTGSSAPDRAGVPTALPVPGPQFCGVPIVGSTVIYLLDRGDSASEIFDALKQATYASIATLGPDRKFQILFWDNHTDDACYPPIGPTDATPENLAACTKTLDDVTAYHQSEITKPLRKAVAENPDLIIVATAKGFELDDTFRATVEAITRGTSVKLDTISLHGTDCPALQALANNSGGTYKALSDPALRAAAQ